MASENNNNDNITTAFNAAAPVNITTAAVNNVTASIIFSSSPLFNKNNNNSDNDSENHEDNNNNNNDNITAAFNAVAPVNITAAAVNKNNNNSDNDSENHEDNNNNNNNNLWWTPEKCPHYMRWCEGNICSFCMYSKDLIYKANEYVPLASLEKYKIYTWMKLCWACIDDINGNGEREDNGDNDDNGDDNQRLYDLLADFGEDPIPPRDPSAPFGPGPRLNEHNIFF